MTTEETSGADQTANGETATAEDSSPSPRLGDLGRQMADTRQQTNFLKGELKALRADMAKILKGDDAKSADKSEANGKDDSSQLEAMRQLGRIESSLPDKARERIDQMIRDGKSYGDALAIAEILLATGAKSEGASTEDGDSKRRDPGAAARAASNRATGFAGTKGDFLKLRQTDPKRARQLAESAEFDFGALPD